MKCSKTSFPKQKEQNQHSDLETDTLDSFDSSALGSMSISLLRLTEACVEMRLRSQRDYLLEMAVVNVRINSKQSFENDL
jgi:hypothetical protein